MDDNNPANIGAMPDDGLPNDEDLQYLNTDTQDMNAALAEPVPESTEGLPAESAEQPAAAVEQASEPEAVPQSPAPVVDAATILANNQDLLNQINGLIAPPQETEQTQALSAEPQQGTENQQSVFTFDDSIMDNMLDDPKAYADHIAQVVSAHIAQETPMMIQQTLQAHQQEAQQYQQMADTFYTVNPELVGHEATVQQVAQNLAAQYPGISTDQLLTFTAHMVKSHVTSNQNVTEQPLGNTTQRSLSSVGQSGNVVSQPQVSDQEAEFAATLAFAENNRISL